MTLTVNLPGLVAKPIEIFDKASLPAALEGFHTAFYLVHSMKNKSREFSQMGREGAENFLNAAESSGVQRIVYLGDPK